MTKTELFARTAIVLALACASSGAYAQTTGTSPEPTESPETDADPQEIVVTAQRREQALIDVPQSISVIGGETLERQQARSFLDYAALVPGFTVTQANPGEARLILRGINTGGGGSTVATYVDDTPFGASGSLSDGGELAGDFDTFDVARVEVLRGPQGTLYGSNSLGGVLKFITNEPSTRAFEVRGQAGIDTTRFGEIGYLGNAVVNVPLGDTLAFRASGFYRKSGGYLEASGRNGRNVNESDSYGGRASLLFRPDDRLSVRLFGLFQKIDTDSSSTFLANPVSLLPVNPLTGARVGKRDRRRFENIAEFARLDYRLYAGTIDYDFGAATLTSVTSYSEQTRDDRTDASNEGVRGLSDLIYSGGANTTGLAFDDDVRVEKFTQEVRLQSADSDRFEWLIGGYYTDEKTALSQEAFPFTLGTQALIPPATTISATFPIPPFRGVSFNQFVVASIDAKYEEIAGFANATLKFGDRFDITVGGRYSHNKQSSTQQVLVIGNGPANPGDSSEGVFTYSVSPRFEFSDRASVYARVAKGYRPGGPNFVPAGARADFPVEFNSDTLVSYEAGFRGQTADRKFSIDASVYYIDWDDILIASSVITDAGPAGINANGRRARSKGGELTATFRPVRGFSVIASAAYNDSKLRDDTTIVPGGPNLTGGLAGDELPYSPRVTGNISADYEWSLSDGVEAFVGANLRAVDDQTAGFSAAYRAAFGRRIRIDNYETVDLRAGANIRGFTVQAFARNVFDVEGVVSAGLPSPVSPAFGGTGTPLLDVSVIRPRTIGLIVGAQF